MDDLEQESTPATMIPPITFEQARVLGCLVEKELTTPENYPLTLNSLLLACNQTTNREPVVSFSEDIVRDALGSLLPRGFVFQVSIPGARVQKFKHNLNGKFPRLEKPGLALMAVLLLRGPQTVGELRQRSERLQTFPDLAAVESILKELVEYPGTPLVTMLPAGGGRKAVTYAHTLCGPVDAAATPVTHSSATVSSGDGSWRERIERELADLRAEVACLRAQIASSEPPSSVGVSEVGDAPGSRFIP